MYDALAITFREGLSAFLIVGVVLACFHRVGDEHLRRAVRSAIALSVLTSAAAAALFSAAENQAWWEGVLAFASAVALCGMAVYLHHRLQTPGTAPADYVAQVLTALFTTLMITRGGMEIALLVGTMVALVRANDVILGALAGTVLAVGAAWLWWRMTRTLSTSLFRQVTTTFLVLYVFQLVIDGIHEGAEANVSTWSAIHDATEALSSDGVYGYYAPYLLIVVPLAWWLLAIFLRHGKASDDRVAHVGR